MGKLCGLFATRNPELLLQLLDIEFVADPFVNGMLIEMHKTVESSTVGHNDFIVEAANEVQLSNVAASYFVLSRGCERENLDLFEFDSADFPACLGLGSLHAMLRLLHQSDYTSTG